MGWVFTAIVASAVIGAYSTKQASKTQAKAMTQGQQVEKQTADENLRFQREMANEQRADVEPWRAIGVQALKRIRAGVQSGEFEVGKIDLTKDPGYKFRLSQGVQALDRSASARGRLLSGSQQKALTEYGQDMGSQEYSNAYIRESNKLARRYNILSSLAQGGQTSAVRQAQASGQLALTGGNIMSSQGRAGNLATQQVGATRASAYKDYGQIANQGIQNWMQYKQYKNAGGG